MSKDSSEATELLEVLYGAETWRTNPEALLGALEERLAGQTHLSGEAPDSAKQLGSAYSPAPNEAW